MIPDSSMLGEFWLAVVAHLWQTTLVLLPLFILARAVRNAPARLANALWTIGLVKVFLPRAVVLPLARRTVFPFLERVMPFAFGSGASSVWLGRAYVVIDPTVLAISGRSNDLKLGAALLGLLTLAWIGGVVYLGIRWSRLRQTGASREAVPAAQVRGGLGVRVMEAAGYSPDRFRFGDAGRHRSPSPKDRDLRGYDRRADCIRAQGRPPPRE